MDRVQNPFWLFVLFGKLRSNERFLITIETSNGSSTGLGRTDCETLGTLVGNGKTDQNPNFWDNGIKSPFG